MKPVCRRPMIGAVAAFTLTLFVVDANAQSDVILFETETFRLEVGTNAVARSLVVKATGEEMIDARDGLAMFSVTQERPFNNEIKLMWPHKRTAYPANRVRRDGDRLVIGFETAPYEAVVGVKPGDGYLAFELEGFNCVRQLTYGGLCMDLPPAARFRVLQLPVKLRENVGDWLNVVWDDRAAVAVVGADPYAEVDHESRTGCEVLHADFSRGMRLKGGRAAIVAGAGRDAFLVAMDGLERDFNLPRGVQNRRDSRLKASIYWAGDLNPNNVDEHIAMAKSGGFRMMLVYFTAMTKAQHSNISHSYYYRRLGDYDWNAAYPNGVEDLKGVLSKVKAAGITPGFHTLQTHIGCDSRYVTPVADPRLNLTRRFTLARPVAADGDPREIEVLENPVDAPLYAKSPDRTARVLKFGGELFSYGGYTTEPPYRFTDVRRGHWNTAPAAHPRGEIGGVLDVSEFGGMSCYIDQTTDLQDEVAVKIAKIYDAGFEFCYFDGSEGVNPPCGVNVALSQWRVVSKFAKPPVFTEGAAKSHFGWHLQAGANAFDMFHPEIFKAMIVKFPQTEAPLMRKDFTRIDFGWWTLYLPGQGSIRTIGTQPDMWEFGTSRAAAWDCPTTVQFDLDRIARHPRIKDLMEVLRRWEDVRAKNWLTTEQKEMLKDPVREHHLYLNEAGGYELVNWKQIPIGGGKFTPGLRAFLFEREGKRVVAYWHTSGRARYALADGAGTEIEAEGLKYFKTDLSTTAATDAFANSREIR
ncbi:MAG: hypothetical protein IKF72_07755 [Kiritimatiellae bacterium]|nr:hypothetical protein [Kiritimatiellia bacterium]